MQDEAVPLAVLGGVGEAGRIAFSTLPRSTGLPLEARLAGDALAVGAAEQAHGELGPPGAEEARHADDLAAAHRQAHILHREAIGMERVAHAPARHLQEGFADRHTLPGG